MAPPEGTASLPAGLYLVSTPIGNLGDITLRAIEILQAVDRVACEDTRVTGKLLAHLGISKPLVSYRDENEQRLAPSLAQAVAEGERLALVSDAGTPLISDPGFRLVRTCRNLGAPVFSIPGATALISALSVSGLPSHAFSFLGFLPVKAGRRRSLLEIHLELDQTTIFYESTHRILRLLEELCQWLEPDRRVAVVRELTKKFETFKEGTAAEVLKYFQQSSVKGEFVVLIAPSGFGPLSNQSSFND